jgi:hypothetical protein
MDVRDAPFFVHVNSHRLIYSLEDSAWRTEGEMNSFLTLHSGQFGNASSVHS